jgi:Ran GTPase-activating protein (RanGAP) involved in mRNA processing and transport
VLGQCRELVHLNLSGNPIGAAGVESLAGVLGQCTALAHLDLSCNQIGDGGAERFAGGLAQSTPLTHLNLFDNKIGAVRRGRLRASWRGHASDLLVGYSRRGGACTAC